MRTVMHITEVSSGGVLPIIVGLANRMVEDCNVIVLYGIRFDTPKDIERLFDNRVILIPMKELTRSISFARDSKAIKSVRQYVHKYNPDVIHFHSSKAGYIGRLGLLRYKCMKIYSPHGYSFLKADNNIFKKIIFFAAEIVLAHTGCLTLACGKGEYKLARKLHFAAECLENGIDTNLIDSYLDETQENEVFAVYTVGRISPQKDPKMFNELASRFPKTRFVWIGDGEDRVYLSSPNIEITGVLDRKNVIKVAQRIPCYVSCSPSEGLPIALEEAMYLGKACVVTDVSGNNDLINDENGYLYNDIDQCGKILKLLMEDFSKAENKRLQARKTIEDLYNMDIMHSKYRKIIGF